MEKLKGKIAVVTGGNSGVGLATAERFAADGAHVFVLVRRHSDIDNVVRKIGQHATGNVTGIEGDVANVADLDRFYEVVKAKGRIDILFANAALGEFAPWAGASEGHLDKAMGLHSNMVAGSDVSDANLASKSSSGSGTTPAGPAPLPAAGYEARGTSLRFSSSKSGISPASPGLSRCRISVGAKTRDEYDVQVGNLKGLVFTVEKALPLFRDGGSIILNASPGVGDGVPPFGMNGAVKSALRSFARCWSADLGHRQIRVNVVSPRPSEAYGLQSVGQLDALADHASLMAGLPRGKAGISVGIANVAAVLASDESSFITGLEVFVDGGPSLN